METKLICLCSDHRVIFKLQIEENNVKKKSFFSYCFVQTESFRWRTEVLFLQDSHNNRRKNVNWLQLFPDFKALNWSEPQLTAEKKGFLRELTRLLRVCCIFLFLPSTQTHCLNKPQSNIILLFHQNNKTVFNSLINDAGHKINLMCWQDFCVNLADF